MYCRISRFSEAKFCGVPSRFFVKLGCVAGEKEFRNTVINDNLHTVNSEAHTAKMSEIILREIRRVVEPLLCHSHFLHFLSFYNELQILTKRIF